jgi:chaperonin cofactor prefoldin
LIPFFLWAVAIKNAKKQKKKVAIAAKAVQGHLTPTLTSDTGVDAVFFDHATCDEGDDSDIILKARHERLQACSNEATPDRTIGPVRYENLKGISVLEKLDARLETIDILQSEVKSLEARGEDLEGRVKDLEDRVKDLEGRVKDLEGTVVILSQCSDGYLQVCNRFFACFRRDKLAELSAIDRKAIASENLHAHAGDALVDAVLYDKKIRRYEITFILLYGMAPGTVLELRESSCRLDLRSIVMIDGETALRCRGAIR